MRNELLLLIMAVNLPILTDGDAAFARVDARRAPHQLEPGTVAEAENCAFEYGEARPRLGLSAQAWGQPGRNLLAQQNWPTREDMSDAWSRIDLELVVGERYVWLPGNSQHLTTEFVILATGDNPAGTFLRPGAFVAHQTWYYLWGQDWEQPVTARILAASRTLALARFNDPEGFDTLIVITDEWRTGPGEDNGRGRAWRLVSGNLPQEIPMNGQDAWSECRLVQAHNGMVLLRHGLARHYFGAGAVDAVQHRLQLNAPPAWQTGDFVRFRQAYGGSAIVGPAPPKSGSRYYVKNVGTNAVELYLDIAQTQQLQFGAATGHFYLERDTEAAGFFGNGAPPLLMQPQRNNTATEVGFQPAPTTQQITDTESGGAGDTEGTVNTLTVASHRLLPGDEVRVTGITGTLPATAYWVNPVSDHLLRLYDDQLKALAGGADGLVQLTVDDETGTLTRANASSLPMPPGREAIWWKQRLILVNGAHNLAISDPLDPLHYRPFLATLSANLGESDRITALVPLGEDTLLVLKENSVLALLNLARAASEWQLLEVTREYGCIAPLSVAQSGRDVWFLSRRGVVSIAQTELGKQVGVALPVSDPIQRYLNRVDWARAEMSAAGNWNNRYMLAVPLKGQTEPILNNGLLVYNFLNQGWEGLWQGELLHAAAFARCRVFGDERLCLAHPEGFVGWLGDGWDDLGVAIQTRLVTRGYLCGNPERKLFLSADLNLDSHHAQPSVRARAQGYLEEQTLLNALAYDRTQYLAHSRAAYDPTNADADFDTARREDYSVAPPVLANGARVNIHQNLTERLRLRLQDRSVQLVIENQRGSLRLLGLTLRASPLRTLAARTT